MPINDGRYHDRCNSILHATQANIYCIHTRSLFSFLSIHFDFSDFYSFNESFFILFNQQLYIKAADFVLFCFVVLLISCFDPGFFTHKVLDWF